jgi:hypothetical protein
VLNIDHLFKYYLAILVYKSLYLPETIPMALHSLFRQVPQIHTHATRASTSGSLFTQPCNIKARHNAAAIQGPLIWNFVPLAIKDLQSLRQFKTNLYSFYLTLQNSLLP